MTTKKNDVMGIMLQRDHGYEKARHMDRLINETTEYFSIEEHPWLWLTLTRTVMTTLTLIEEIAQKAIEDA